MKVVEITGPGGPEVLRVGERPDPDPGPGEVRVKVAASGINRADLMQRRGRYPVPPGYPDDIPGLEFAGEIEAVGTGCFLRRSGDRVMGILGGAGYAEKVVVPERETIRVPNGISLEVAGGLAEVFVTAWDALSRQAGLSAGETVLIHAVGSGVGTAALQLARASGARTIGTSRTPRKLERARDEMGLDEAVEGGASGEWAQQVRGWTNGAGVDVILDLVGAAYVEGNLAVLGTRARWIVVGVPSGRKAEVDLRGLMQKRASLTGTVLRARPPEEKAVLARDFERTVVPLFESGHLRPVLDRSFAPEEAAEAHRYMEADRTFGKVVLRWSRKTGVGAPS